jgi:hypothetical protein
MSYSKLGKTLFRDISSTNIDTLVPLVYPYVETRIMEVFWLLCQPLPFQLLCHQRNIFHPVVSFLMRQISPTVNMKHFFVNIVCIESCCPQKNRNITLLFGIKLLNHSSHFDYWNQPLNMSIRVCFVDCHEAGIVLLPSGIYRKPITFITAALLPFVTNLLTLPRITIYMTCTTDLLSQNIEVMQFVWQYYSLMNIGFTCLRKRKCVISV